MPMTVAASPSRSSTSPETSMGVGFGSRDGLIQRNPSARANATTGRFTTNSHRQLPTARMAPAISGPRVRKVVPPVDSRPIAQPRCFSTTTVVVFARARGWISAPPMPCTNRAPISSPRSPAIAQVADASPKTAAPVRNSRRRPKWSASRPATAMNTASANRYAVIVHCSCDEGARNVLLMAGNATVTAVWSKNSSAFAASVEERTCC